MSQTLDAVEKTEAVEQTDVVEKNDVSAAEGGRAEAVGSEGIGTGVDSTFGQFEYVPMPVIAPVAGVLGVCSLIAFLGLFGILLAGIGIVVGLLASWKVYRSHGDLSGMKPALSGLLLSLFSAVGGTALMVYNYQHEVPEGFQRVSFAQDISDNAFVVEDGVKDLHPDLKALVGQPIFVKGFMYPTGKEYGLTELLLLKDSGQCCFGRQPALQDMIGVRMKDGVDVDYYGGRVSVAGTFKINPEYRGQESLEPLFLLETEFFNKAKTAF